VRVDYTVNEDWKPSLRAEYFDGGDGYRTGVVRKRKEVTGTIAYRPARYADQRLELRGDNSDLSSVSESDGADYSESQQSTAAQALYKF
jgi:hypothetical protein